MNKYEIEKKNRKMCWFLVYMLINTYNYNFLVSLKQHHNREIFSVQNTHCHVEVETLTNWQGRNTNISKSK